MRKTTIFKQALLAAIVLMSSSCATIQHQVLLGDVISFGNDAITSYECPKGKSKNMHKQGDPYMLYSPSTGVDNKVRFKMIARINGTQMENNTAGIYAMDLALDRIQYIQKHQLKRDPNAKYYVIFMTDGLDNISAQVAKITSKETTRLRINTNRLLRRKS